MSKKRKALKADTTDIVCRIITALLAAAVPVVSYFMNLIYYVVESSVFKLLSQLQGNTEDDGSTYGYISFHYLFSEIIPKDTGKSGDALATIWENTQVIHVPMIITAVFFALIILTAVVILFVSIFSNSKKAPLFLALFGFACTIGMFIAFRRVSIPITDGTISLTSFFESELAKLILPYVAKISILNLSSAWVMMMIIYIAIALFALAQILITPKKAKALKTAKAK